MKQLNNIYSEKTLDLIEDIVYFKDPKGIYITCNKAFCDFFSLKREDIIGKSDYDLFSKEDAEAFRKNDKEVMSKQEEIKFTETLIHLNDKKIYFTSKKSVVLDEDNNIIATMGISKNITKQKEYETLYETSQKVLEKIIENDSLEETCNFIINEAQSINKNMICSILLLDKKEQRFTKGFAPSLPQVYNDAVKTLIIGKGVGSCGTAAFTKQRVIVENIDEHPYWADYTALTNPIGLHACWSQPFFSKNKEVLGTFAIYYNKAKAPNDFELKLIDSFSYLVSLAVNKRKELDVLKENENLIIQQSKLTSIADMLESISHHWRQPLSVISTVCSALKIDKEYYDENEEEYDKALNKVVKTTKELSYTIDQFSNYLVKSQSKEHFLIEGSMSKVLNILDAKLKDSKIQIVSNVENISLFTYENEVINIILNLINNSYDAFILNQTSEPIIFIDIKEKFESCIITIKDNAGGIDSKVQERIFEPYFTTKDNKLHGTGIGLYMVQDILTRHLKGKIKVENQEYTYKDSTYTGALFTITIPIKE